MAQFATLSKQLIIAQFGLFVKRGKMWDNIFMFCLTLKIYGSVQGVGFRWRAREKAKKLGLVGYVKNLSDGTVELVAEGEEEQLKKMLEYCKIGPWFAHVEMVEEEWKSVSGLEFEDFKIVF